MDLEEGQFHHRYHPPLPFHQYLLHPFIHRICIIFLQPMQTTSKQWDQGKIWFIRTIFAGISLSITLHPIHNWHPNHVAIFWNFCWFVVFIAFLILFDFLIFIVVSFQFIDNKLSPFILKHPSPNLVLHRRHQCVQ